MAASQRYIKDILLAVKATPSSGSWLSSTTAVLEAEWHESLNEAGRWSATILAEAYAAVWETQQTFVELVELEANGIDVKAVLFEGALETAETAWGADARPRIRLSGATSLGRLMDEEYDGLIAQQTWSPAIKTVVVNQRHERALNRGAFVDGNAATWDEVALVQAAEPDEDDVDGVLFSRLQVSHPSPFDAMRLTVQSGFSTAPSDLPPNTWHYDTAGVEPYHPGATIHNLPVVTFEGQDGWHFGANGAGHTQQWLLYHFYSDGVQTDLYLEFNRPATQAWPVFYVFPGIYDPASALVLPQDEPSLIYSQAYDAPSWVGDWRTVTTNFTAPAGINTIMFTTWGTGPISLAYLRVFGIKPQPLDLSSYISRQMHVELFDGVWWQSTAVAEDTTQEWPNIPFSKVGQGQLAWQEFPLFMPTGDPLSDASGYLARFWARNPTVDYDPDLGPDALLGGGLPPWRGNGAEVLVAEPDTAEFTTVQERYGAALGFSLAVGSATGSTDGTLWRYLGETPLGIMQELAQRTGFNFRALPGSQIAWFEGFPVLDITSGISQSNPDAIPANFFYLTKARRIHGRRPQVRRVQVYGAGTDQVSKIDISRYVPGDVTLPTGYVVQNGQIINTNIPGATVESGRLRTLDYPHIGSGGTTRELSAELVKMGIQFLMKNAEESFHLEVEGHNLSNAAHPGGQMEVLIPQLGGVQTAVSGWFVITSITHSIDAEGLRYYKVGLSNTGAHPIQDWRLLAEAHLTNRRRTRYPQPASAGQLVRRGNGAAGSGWETSGVDEDGNIITDPGSEWCIDDDGIRYRCGPPAALPPSGGGGFTSDVFFPALQNSFETGAFGNNPPHYWREGNTIFFGGSVRYNNGSGANGGVGDYTTTGPGLSTPIFSVPPGYRAMTGHAHFYFLDRSGSAAPPVGHVVKVMVEDDTLYFQFSTSSGIGFGSGVALDGISFRTEDAWPT